MVRLKCLRNLLCRKMIIGYMKDGAKQQNSGFR